MKERDAHRAAVLVAAKKALEARIFDRPLRQKVDSTWDFIGARIGAGQIGLGNSGDFDCVSVSAWIDLDAQTMRALIPRMLDVIGDELAKIGVKP